MTQVSKLSGWPPQGGAGAFDTRSETFVSSPELVTVKSVDRIVHNRVDITCRYGAEVVTFRFFAADVGIAENVANLLKINTGRNLKFIGNLNVPRI